MDEPMTKHHQANPHVSGCQAALRLFGIVAAGIVAIAALGGVLGTVAYLRLVIEAWTQYPPQSLKHLTMDVSITVVWAALLGMTLYAGVVAVQVVRELRNWPRVERLPKSDSPQ